MKTRTAHGISSIAILACALFLGTEAQAAISGTDTSDPYGSYGYVDFNDASSHTLSLNSGSDFGSLSRPWDGSIVTLPLTTDPTTGDSASGDLVASYSGNDYAIDFSNISLTQVAGNSGHALLTLGFSVQYQLDADGLPSEPTPFPFFAINGTVLSGGSVGFNGYIFYAGTNTSGQDVTLDTVNYSYSNSSPGAYSTTVGGVPQNGSTVALAPNSVLIVGGSFSFLADPSSIYAESVPAPVPEPSSWALIGVGLVSLFACRQRKRSAV